jgi:cell wall-associated NlpC family hydrolase
MSAARTVRTLAASVFLVVLIAASGAGATPEIRAQRDREQAVRAQIQTLNEEVSAAAERYNGANYRLQRLMRELRTTKAQLARARSGYRVAHERAARRLVELYVAAPQESAIEVILGARGLTEMVDALETRDRVASFDAAIAERLRTFRARMTQRERRLRAATAKQRDVVRRREAERAAIEANLSERERLLASVRSEIRRLEAREQARQAELERRARAAAAEQRALAAANADTAERPEPGAAPRVEPLASAPSSVEFAPAAPPPADESRGAQVVAIAMRYLGVPYKWGGASPSTGFDCSGFTMYVFAQIGVSLPHYAAAQYGMGVPIARDHLAAGDLVFFRGLGHMGMYIGGGSFIHAPQTGDVVKISSINEPYRIASWVGARRVL